MLRVNDEISLHSTICRLSLNDLNFSFWIVGSFVNMLTMKCMVAADKLEKADECTGLELSVVVPVYNSASTLKSLMVRLSNVLTPLVG